MFSNRRWRRHDGVKLDYVEKSIYVPKLETQEIERIEVGVRLDFVYNLSHVPELVSLEVKKRADVFMEDT